MNDMTHRVDETGTDVYAISDKGRPSLFKQDPHGICELAVRLGTKGYGVAQIAACIGISKETLRVWRHSYPMFDEAMERALTMSQSWWEGQAMNGRANAVIGGTIWSKSMSARFPSDYTDKTKIETTTPPKDITPDMTDREAYELYQASLKG